MTIRAEPFTPLPAEKLTFLLDKLVAHDPWFGDLLDTPEKRREASSAYIVDACVSGRVWECWRDTTLVGLLLLNEMVPFQDARCHFVFFDSKLADKEQLCLQLMAHAYDSIPLEVLRVQIPTYAKALLKYIRKLGFRYEAESRIFSWPTNASPLSADVAKLGSRLHRASLYRGSWHDVLLLSQTRDEFFAAHKELLRGRTLSQQTQPSLPTEPHPTGP